MIEAGADAKPTMPQKLQFERRQPWGNIRSATRVSKSPLRALEEVHDHGLAGSTATRRCLSLRGGGGSEMSVRGAWAILFGATAFELVSTGFMHQAKGFSVPLPAFGAVVFYAASFYAFNLSLRKLEISVAYAVWSAVVMAALSAIGMTVLGESVSGKKIMGILAIIVGTTLLSLADVAAA